MDLCQTFGIYVRSDDKLIITCIVNLTQDCENLVCFGSVCETSAVSAATRPSISPPAVRVHVGRW